MDKVFDHSKRHVLDSHERRRNLDSKTVLQFMGLHAHHNFLDVGSGTGYFFLPALEVSDNESFNVGLDISEIMIDELKSKVENSRKNVQLIQADAHVIPVDEKIMDKVLLAFVFHEFEDPQTYLKELQRILKLSGEIAVLEWKDSLGKSGPPMHERIPESELMETFEEAGFTFKRAKMLNDQNYMHVYGLS